MRHRSATQAARERALDQAKARGARQEAFAERLLGDPPAVRARVRETLEQCASAFFDAAWAGAVARINADLRVKADLRDSQGLGAALAAVAGAHPRPGPHTTTELAHAWNLTPPEVSRHLAVLQRAGLVTGERRGRYVHYAADLPALAALGTDLVATVLR